MAQHKLPTEVDGDAVLAKVWQLRKDSDVLLRTSRELIDQSNSLRYFLRLALRKPIPATRRGN